MPHNHDEEEEVSVEELLISQVYAVQAVINVLERKGLITREEIFEEIRAIEEAAGECDCECECDCNCDCGEDH